MSRVTPPVVPPAAFPPPPDDPEPSRSPLVAAFVLGFLVAVVFVMLAVQSLLREPTATISPTPTPTPRPDVNGGFRFLERAPGGAPVRWDPCDPITYAVNVHAVTSSVRPDLREALRRVTRATGIEFESAGTTMETFMKAYQRMRYQGMVRKAELILIWVDHEDYRAILRRLQDPRPSIAFAKTMAGLHVDRDQYFGGIVVMDADATASRGFGDPYTHGSVLLHELGHIMGLDHVKDPDQLMYSGRHPNYGLRDFGPGDLEGLRRLGMEAGCID
jgi:hypothetical protein